MRKGGREEGGREEGKGRDWKEAGEGDTGRGIKEAVFNDRVVTKMVRGIGGTK